MRPRRKLVREFSYDGRDLHSESDYQTWTLTPQLLNEKVLAVTTESVVRRSGKDTGSLCARAQTHVKVCEEATLSRNLGLIENGEQVTPCWQRETLAAEATGLVIAGAGVEVVAEDHDPAHWHRWQFHGRLGPPQAEAAGEEGQAGDWLRDGLDTVGIAVLRMMR